MVRPARMSRLRTMVRLNILPTAASLTGPPPTSDVIFEQYACVCVCVCVCVCIWPLPGCVCVCVWVGPARVGMAPARVCVSVAPARVCVCDLSDLSATH
jgi:hypothetical protein